MYRENELLAFSDIAYWNLGNEYDLLSADEAKYPDKKVPIGDLLSLLDEKERNKKINFLHEQYGISEVSFLKWKIATRPTDTNGFYACVIETSPGEASVAFRGSESLLNPEAVDTDWKSNFQLITRTLTDQQREVDNFLKQNSSFLQTYDHLTFAGHSLGGNNALYAAIVSDKYGLDEKIDQCANMDGPGMGKQFMKEHYDQINNMKGKISHYQWSFVGTILNSIEGTEIYIKTKEDDPNSIKIQQEAERHNRNQQFVDKASGMLERTDNLGSFPQFIHEMTCNLDEMPSWYKSIVEAVVIDQGLNAMSGAGHILEWYDGLPGWQKNTITAMLLPVGIVGYGAYKTIQIGEKIYDTGSALSNWVSDRIKDGYHALEDVWNYFSGNKKENKETAEQKAARLTSNEAASTISFTINPAVFVSLGNGSHGAEQDINCAVTASQKVSTLVVSEGVDIQDLKKPTPNPHGSPVVRQLNNEIKELYNKIKELQGAAGGVADLCGSVEQTIGGCIDYLLLTGNEFIELEAEAKSRVSSWNM